jgi:hypothetical protein
MWENWYVNQEKKYGNVKYGNEQKTVKSELDKKNIILNDIINNVEKGIFIKNEGPTAVLTGVHDLNRNVEINYDDNDDNDGNDNDNDNNNNDDYNENNVNNYNDNAYNNDSFKSDMDIDIDVSINHDHDDDILDNHVIDNKSDYNHDNYNNDKNYNNNNNNNSSNHNNIDDKIDDSVINDVRSHVRLRTRSSSIGKWNQVFEQIKSIGADRCV